MIMEQRFGTNSAVIRVMGVGGGGCNAINSMIDSGVSSAEFFAINTDNQALLLSHADNCIQIGAMLTKGLGAGSDPNVGEAAAEESKEEIADALKGTDLLFIAAGMGGGTGTGAASVIARIARELGILTVAVVTKPFSFEGRVRNENAKKGIANLKKYVDTLVVIPNDKLLQSLPASIGVLDAFKVADDMLKQGIIGIVDLIATPSLINLDFADVNTVMRNQGLAHMGIGRAKGEDRAEQALKMAIESPLLESKIDGAKAVLFNVAGGFDVGLMEIAEVSEKVKEVIADDALFIFGTSIDESLGDEIEVTIIATGFEDRVGGFASSQRKTGLGNGSDIFNVQSSGEDQTLGVPESEQASESAPAAGEGENAESNTNGGGTGFSFLNGNEGPMFEDPAPPISTNFDIPSFLSKN